MCNRSNTVEYSALCLGDNPPDDCYPYMDPITYIVWLTFLVLNMLPGLIGNLLTLLSIPYAMCHQRLGFNRDLEPTTLYMLNLALCDFLFCAVATPFSMLLIVYRGWPLGQRLCTFSAVFRMTMTGAGWVALSLLSFSRFVLLKWPKSGKILFSGKAAMVHIIIIWCIILLALLASSFLVIYIFVFGLTAKLSPKA
jgi:hypothetical protein